MSLADKRIYIADLSATEQGHLDELLLLWRSKRGRNALRAGFYDMQNATDSLMTSKVPSVIRRRKFVLGWSAIAVDKLARRCNLEGFYEPNGADLDALGLSDLLRENRFELDFNQVGVSSLIHAVSFITTTQGDVEAGEPEVLMLGRDALTSSGVWDVRRRAIGKFLSIGRFDEDGEPSSMTMYLPNLNVMMTKESGSWSATRREHIFGVPVDPIRYKPRLGRQMGSSRISRAVMSIHMQALGAMIRADVNGEAYSMPRYALLGATEEAFKNADGTPKPTWQAAWDAIWAIGDDPDATSDALARADVKQFNGQSPEPQNQHLRMLAQLFSGETGIPVGELGIMADSNPTSAEALTVSRDDIISEAEATTDNWSPDLSAAVTRGLEMLNRGAIPAGFDLKPRWRSPVHQSRASVVDAGQKQVAAVPWLAETTVGLRLLGLSEGEISDALAERQRATSRANVTALAAVAQQRSATDAVEI